MIDLYDYKESHYFYITSSIIKYLYYFCIKTLYSYISYLESTICNLSTIFEKMS